MNRPQNHVLCMIFRQDNTEAMREGLGVHPFGRIPVMGEYINLSERGPRLKVTAVLHTGFGSHSAEITCTAALRVEQSEGGPSPPSE